MEPRLFSHGNSSDMAANFIITTCFNGATTFQSWKRRGRSLSRPRRQGCFNGATTFQSWKLRWAVRPYRRIERASMEPRLFSHGNHRGARQEGNAAHASMEPRLFSHGNRGVPSSAHITNLQLQWSHDFSVMETTQPIDCILTLKLSFNGATTFQSWKPDANRAKKLKKEGRFNGATTFQSWKPAACGRRTSTRICFNGATTFQSWKPQQPQQDAQQPQIASMEPRLFSHGNPLDDIAAVAYYGASMEPRLFSHGNAGAEGWHPA